MEASVGMVGCTVVCTVMYWLDTGTWCLPRYGKQAFMRIGSMWEIRQVDTSFPNEVN